MGFKWLLNVINSKFVSYSVASNAISHLILSLHTTLLLLHRSQRQIWHHKLHAQSH